jgi:hypothetical protein
MKRGEGTGMGFLGRVEVGRGGIDERLEKKYCGRLPNARRKIYKRWV